MTNLLPLITLRTRTEEAKKPTRRHHGRATSRATGWLTTGRQHEAEHRPFAFGPFPSRLRSRNECVRRRESAKPEWFTSVSHSGPSRCPPPPLD
ncbi:hypothetical protein CEXT_544081 [Caerostris extrusa]|uniref:Uncharacterized protein n=1 Tax=Caerostris extrusa TaxID=172846 RepID=A0AAV4SIH4_CAEEX|nr:hypothetical protein CEXT_544081 [Caerostris extrusa]